MDMQAEERIVTLTCVSSEVGGNLAGTATWIGYPIKKILERAGVRGDADMLFSMSMDGWTSGTLIDASTEVHGTPRLWPPSTRMTPGGSGSGRGRRPKADTLSIVVRPTRQARCNPRRGSLRSPMERPVGTPECSGLVLCSDDYR